MCVCVGELYASVDGMIQKRSETEDPKPARTKNLCESESLRRQQAAVVDSS